MTKLFPLQGSQELINLYGNPDRNNDGSADLSWVREHLTTIVPPYAMFYGDKPVHAITVNKGCAMEMLMALEGIRTHYVTNEAIHDVGLDQFSGCYNFRRKRGGTSLSMHSYACAIDLDAAHNAFGGKTRRMPDKAVEIFEDTGAVWGGHWRGKSYDPMHFQYARVRA